MDKSNKPIIAHIPKFLAYCDKTGLSNNTFKNYKCYLNKFILWLKKEDKNTLLPHELTINDINNYKNFLKDHSLKKISQNHYLIGLRALLGYFITKDIETLPSNKIDLSKGARSEKNVKLLSLDQIEELLLAPNIKTNQGLRDRAILEILISNGFKINKLISLNKNKGEDSFTENTIFWIKKYLETRNDNKEALFINYRSRKNAEPRLTPRSIERLVKKYGRKIKLPFYITPEILRWAYPIALSNKRIKTKKDIFWNELEDIIENKITWLKENIDVIPQRYANNNPDFLKCDDCILRKIASSIAIENIKAAKFYDKKYEDIWSNLKKEPKFQTITRHGQKWHKNIMNAVYEYFKLKNHIVKIEPLLNQGRADLGIFPEKDKPIYIEIGTISLFKLWYNLMSMKNVRFLIIQNENNIIEFNI